MRKTNAYLFVVAFTLGFSQVYSQEDESPTYQSYTKAKQIFDGVIEKNRYGTIDILYYSLSGTWRYLGHYSLPRKRKNTEVKEKIFMRGRDNLKLEGELVSSGNKYNKEVYYYDGLSLRNYGESNSTTHFADIREQDDLVLLSPVTLINDVRKNVKTLRYIGRSKKDTCEVLTYSSFLGKQIALYVRDDGIVLRAETLGYHNMNGDYVAEYLYQDYTFVEEFLLPSKMTIKKWGVIEKVLNYEYQELVEKEVFHTQYTLKKIGDNFYTIALPDNQNRVFAIDFGMYLGIIEAPVSNEYSARVYEALRAEFPKKEIKYLFLTHHHPDHAGGFDYYLNQGVTIVTTEISKKYFEELSARKHTIKNDFSSASKKGNFKIVSTGETKEIKTENQSIFIYEFGKGSLHTEEYLLYYLPQQKSLVTGDLWSVPQRGVYGSERAKNIDSLIQKKGIDVKYMYQTWPLRNMKKVAGMEELQESVRLLKQKK